MMFTLFFVLVTAAFGADVLPNSCEHLSDGFHWLKLLDGDDFPAVYLRCSNGYAILDYTSDNNIKSYFTSWSEWHKGTFGPSNDFSLNWQDWFLPDTTYNPRSPLNPAFDTSFFQRPDSSDLATHSSEISQISSDTSIASKTSKSAQNDANFHYISDPSAAQQPERAQMPLDPDDATTWDGPASNSYNYLISPDCAACDLTSERQLYGTQTTYWMTGTLFGCFWRVKGAHNCDVDWDTDTCYTCLDSEANSVSASDGSDDTGTSLVDQGHTRVPVGDASSSEEFDYTGICPHNVRNSNYYVPLTHDQCAHDEADRRHLKPSLGGRGKNCVCVQPKVGYSQFYQVAEIPDAPDQHAQHEVDVMLNVQTEHMRETGRNDIENEDSMDLYELRQEDFAKGTFRIKVPGKYVVMEDIVFDFGAHAKSYAYWPDAEDSELYPGAGGNRDPYFLGYFAGITVECDNVIIELNGHTLEMSEQFYYQQRWFTTIELGTQYFLPGQGIGNFGANPSTASHVIIRNGVLGLSSHHGIHGNYNENVRLLNLQVRDFETHGIQFNGFSQISLKSIEIGPTSTRAFFTGEYGHMRALLPRLKTLSEELEEQEIHFDGRDEPTTLTAITDEIERQLDMAFDYVAHGKEYSREHATDPAIFESFQSAMRLFINPSGIPNGGAMYGIFLNTFGASVFTYNLYTGFYSTGAELEDIYIHDMRHEMSEYVRVFRPHSGDIVINPFNGPLNAEELFHDLEDPQQGWRYKGNVILDAYIALNYFSDDWGYLGMQLLLNSYITPWALGDPNHQVKEETVAFGCNSDVMIHSGKGINGLRLDGVQDVHVKNLRIENLWDHTPLGSDKCGAYDDLACATCGESGGHFRQTQPMQIGFSGNMNQGLNINAAIDVVLEDVFVNGIHSDTGPSFGVSIWPACDVELRGQVSVQRLESGREISHGMLDYADRPNKAPETCGVRVYWEYGDYSTQVRFDDASIESKCLKGHVGCLGNALESDGTVLGTVDTHESCDWSQMNKVNDGVDRLLKNNMQSELSLGGVGKVWNDVKGLGLFKHKVVFYGVCGVVTLLGLYLVGLMLWCACRRKERKEGLRPEYQSIGEMEMKSDVWRGPIPTETSSLLL